MKLCSFRATLKNLKDKQKPNTEMYKRMKDKLINEITLASVFSEQDKSNFEEICPKGSVVGYYKDEKYECFVARLNKFEQSSENPIEIFLIVEEKNYEHAILDSIGKMNQTIKSENLKIESAIEYIKIYLVDKDGLKNPRQRLKSFLNKEKTSLKNCILFAIQLLFFVVSLILMFFHFNDESELWKSIFISSSISSFISVILYICDFFIKNHKLCMDYEEIWEPIQKIELPDFTIDESQVSVDSLDFSVKGDK